LLSFDIRQCLVTAPLRLLQWVAQLRANLRNGVSDETRQDSRGREPALVARHGR
jgi:hypothetical protein